MFYIFFMSFLAGGHGGAVAVIGSLRTTCILEAQLVWKIVRNLFVVFSLIFFKLGKCDKKKKLCLTFGTSHHCIIMCYI